MMARISMLILVTILMAACNLPTAPSTTSTPDAIATQVSDLLTKVPTATPAAPVIVPSETKAQDATATVAIPTTTLTSTSPAPTSTSSPTEANDPPDWTDTLDGGKSFYKYENDNTRVTQEGGHLALTGINANGWLGWSLTFSRKPADFRLEAVFTTQTCSGTDLYGVIFRAPNANAGYFYGVTCDGHYNLHVRDFENDVDTVLINSTNGTGIKTGSNQTNRLGIRAEGEKISLYVNNTLLQEINDATYSSGNLGAFVAANETTGFTVWMEEISLWNIP
jgi:hypothetical protein